MTAKTEGLFSCDCKRFVWTFFKKSILVYFSIISPEETPTIFKRYKNKLFFKNVH